MAGIPIAASDSGRRKGEPKNPRRQMQSNTRTFLPAAWSRKGGEAISGDAGCDVDRHWRFFAGTARSLTATGSLADDVQRMGGKSRDAGS